MLETDVCEVCVVVPDTVYKGISCLVIIKLVTAPSLFSRMIISVALTLLSEDFNIER